MAAAALITILLFELGFAVYRVATRSWQAMPRARARIGLLAAFALLFLIAGAGGSARWAPFAVLLLAWAARSAVTLLRGPRPRYSPVRALASALALSLLAALALLPAFLFPPAAPLPPTGPYAVETITDTYLDPGRPDIYSAAGEPRQVPVQYWLPQDAPGPFPLIVFSHGSFGVIASNISLFTELASHGYVVCSVAHPYQSLSAARADGRTIWLDAGFAREVAAEDAHHHKEQSLQLYQKWMALRGGDLNLVLDTVLAGAGYPNSQPVFQRVDRARVGLVGHSLGGSAVLHVGRTRPGIGAVIALEAPFMGDIAGVKDGQFVWTAEPYPIPVLNVYSDSAWSHLGEWPQYAQNARLLADADPRTPEVHLAGANHLALTDLSLTSPILTRILGGGPVHGDAREHLAAINRVALAFFDAALKQSGTFPTAQEN